MIKHSIEISRPAEEVFAYLDQIDRHNEWQPSLVSTVVETAGPARVGARVLERRKVPGGTRDIRYEVTEHDPRAGPRSVAPPARCVPSAHTRSTRRASRAHA